MKNLKIMFIIGLFNFHQGFTIQEHVILQNSSMNDVLTDCIIDGSKILIGVQSGLIATTATCYAIAYAQGDPKHFHAPEAVCLGTSALVTGVASYNIVDQVISLEQNKSMQAVILSALAATPCIALSLTKGSLLTPAECAALTGVFIAAAGISKNMKIMNE